MNVASGSRWEGDVLRALFLGFALAGDVAADSAPEVFRDLNKPREERNILPADINNRGWIVGTTVAFGFRATGFRDD